MEQLLTALALLGDFLWHVAVVTSIVCTFLVVGGGICLFIVGCCEFLRAGEEQ